MKNFIKKNWPIILILILATILRFSYLLIAQPPLSWYDSGIYDGTAWNMVQGKGYVLTERIPFAGREPGYVLFFLAPIYFIFGHNILAAQVFQIILSLLIILLTYFIAKIFLSKRISLLATFLVAIWPPLIGYCGEIMTETFFIFLFLIFLYFLLKGIKLNSKKIIFLAGIFLGLSTLTHFITFLLPFFLLFLFFLIFRSWKKSFVFFGLILIGFSLFIFPWIIRNYIIFDTFVLGRTGIADVYWMGSYLPWDGEWFGYISPFTSLCPGISDPILKDKCLLKLTLQNIKKNPLGVALIWLKKPFKTFLLPDGYDSIYKFFSKVLKKEIKSLRDIIPIKGLYGGGFLTIWVLAILGLKDLFKKEKIISLIFLFIFLYFFLTILPINPVPRYQLPLLPLMFILASFGLNNLFLLLKVYSNKLLK
jgi:4-amino-4-deoxy-L-arabinose transferase-like glycosyltransferase